MVGGRKGEREGKQRDEVTLVLNFTCALENTVNSG